MHEPTLWSHSLWRDTLLSLVTGVWWEALVLEPTRMQLQLRKQVIDSPLDNSISSRRKQVIACGGSFFA